MPRLIMGDISFKPPEGPTMSMDWVFIDSDELKGKWEKISKFTQMLADCCELRNFPAIPSHADGLKFLKPK